MKRPMSICCGIKGSVTYHMGECRKYNLPDTFGLGPGVDDCCTHFACMYCASHQEMRELAIRGVDGPGMTIRPAMICCHMADLARLSALILVLSGLVPPHSCDIFFVVKPAALACAVQYSAHSHNSQSDAYVSKVCCCDQVCMSWM